MAAPTMESLNLKIDLNIKLWYNYCNGGKYDSIYCRKRQS